jgi:rifampicin phosphotransferase
MSYIVSFDKISDEELKLAGGKGSSLVKLSRLRLPVPSGYIILASAIENHCLIPEAKAEVENLISSLSDKYTYAIRSSALAEDGELLSYAGQYETKIDISKREIIEAINEIITSSKSQRVEAYSASLGKESNSYSQSSSGIAIVIQKFIKAELAGVLFTCDVFSGSSAFMQGNFVYGDGEQLVSGQKNGEAFTYDVFEKKYEGASIFKNGARQLTRYATKIRNAYKQQMDIEWACANGQIHILQARPITTIQDFNMSTYEINESLSGEYLLSKTNVGEIFMTAVSPSTQSLLHSINELMGVSGFISVVEGQAYCNISVVCSMLVSFGLSRKRAFKLISDIAGKIPEGAEVPVFPFDRRNFLRAIWGIIASSQKKPKTLKYSQKEFLDKLPEIARETIDSIHNLNRNDELLSFWNTSCTEFTSHVMTTISKLSTVINAFLNTRQEISNFAGKELADRLCAGSLGILDSMKPLLLLEDVIEGRISESEYIETCGHRSENEMELACPAPYEDPSFVAKAIETHNKSGINVHMLQDNQARSYKQALADFKAKYPSKTKWIDKKMAKFIESNQVRESIRSKAVWLFCVYREFLLQVAKVNNLGDDVFMLYFDEILALLANDKSCLQFISKRLETYKKYQSMPKFPNILIGRFEPSKWMKEENRRLDFYSASNTSNTSSSQLSCEVNGFPGASGKVKGIVHVINRLEDMEEFNNQEILVTNATNIGWTVLFPKAKAIITDIGAPLSHAAIVAREFGIPAVVGCGNATTVLHTGDLVEVDGLQGTVRILK